MQNKTLWAHRIIKGLFTIMIAMGVVMYLIQYDMVADMFSSLGHPSYLVYPLAVAKTLGLVALWSRRSRALTEMAYAGFFFDLMLAIMAHVSVGDGGAGGATLGLVLVSIAYATGKLASQNQ